MQHVCLRGGVVQHLAWSGSVGYQFFVSFLFSLGCCEAFAQGGHLLAMVGLLAVIDHLCGP